MDRFDKLTARVKEMKEKKELMEFLIEKTQGSYSFKDIESLCEEYEMKTEMSQEQIRLLMLKCLSENLRIDLLKLVTVHTVLQIPITTELRRRLEVEQDDGAIVEINDEGIIEGCLSADKHDRIGEPDNCKISAFLRESCKNMQSSTIEELAQSFSVWRFGNSRGPIKMEKLLEKFRNIGPAIVKNINIHIPYKERVPIVMLLGTPITDEFEKMVLLKPKSKNKFEISKMDLDFRRRIVQIVLKNYPHRPISRTYKDSCPVLNFSSMSPSATSSSMASYSRSASESSKVLNSSREQNADVKRFEDLREKYVFCSQNLKPQRSSPEPKVSYSPPSSPPQMFETTAPIRETELPTTSSDFAFDYETRSANFMHLSMTSVKSCSAAPTASQDYCPREVDSVTALQRKRSVVAGKEEEPVEKRSRVARSISSVASSSVIETSESDREPDIVIELPLSRVSARACSSTSEEGIQSKMDPIMSMPPETLSSENVPSFSMAPIELSSKDFLNCKASLNALSRGIKYVSGHLLKDLSKRIEDTISTTRDNEIRDPTQLKNVLISTHFNLRDSIVENGTFENSLFLSQVLLAVNTFLTSIDLKDLQKLKDEYLKFYKEFKPTLTRVDWLSACIELENIFHTIKPTQFHPDLICE